MNRYQRYVIIILGLSLIMPITTANAGALLTGSRSAVLMLTAPSLPNAPGGEITFDVFMSVANITPGVAGADIYLKYNPALVDPAPGAVQVLPNFFGVVLPVVNEELPAEQCPDTDGPCIHLAIAGTPQTTKDGATARFTFKSKAAGLTCFKLIQPKLVDADGFQVNVTNAQEQCIDVAFQSTIAGWVRRQGTPAEPNPGNGTLNCSTVTVLDANGNRLGQAITDRNGSFTLPNLPTGSNFILRAFYPGYLTAQKVIAVTATNPPSTNMMGTVNLLGGDINSDGRIDISDIQLIIAAFGRQGVPVRSAAPINCSNTDTQADINDDGLVNISDLAIAAGNWEKVAPVIWP